jgi:hypothetical protein
MDRSYSGKLATNLAAGLFAVFVLTSTAAASIQFELGSYSVAVQSTDPGLVIEYQKVLGEPHTLPLLNVGGSYTTDLFKIWTDESTVNTTDPNDDTAPKPISVAFGFIAPPPAFGGSVAGSTVGLISGFLGWNQRGSVTWNGPVDVSFGPLGDGVLRISLSNETFSQGVFGLSGNKQGAMVEATFTLIKEPLTVPEPASLVAWSGMALLSLGAAASVRRTPRGKKPRHIA